MKKFCFLLTVVLFGLQLSGCTSTPETPPVQPEVMKQEEVSVNATVEKVDNNPQQVQVEATVGN